MTTARNIITRALQVNGVLTKGEPPSGDEASDGLTTLNNLLSSWSNDSLLIYARLQENFPFVSGKASYTIGSGGDFNTSRPLHILSAFTRIGNIDYDIEVISDLEFDEISQKDLSNSFPNVLFYSAGSPLGTLTFYPVPTGGQLYLRTEKQLTNFPSLDTSLELPPGWERGLIYNLSLETASEYGQPVNEAVYQIAMDALGKIKTAVARNKTMDFNYRTGNNDNIFTGWFT